VVADSVPQLEWEETMNKGRAMFRAVAMVEAGIERHPCVGDDES
jgi:anthranilate synthase component 1